MAGTVLASLGLMREYQLTKDLILRALLPPLIFEAAFLIRWQELRANFWTVLSLASLGVVISAAVVGSAMALFGGWIWPVAIVFGALIAATDPVSVIAMFKELKVHGRLRLLVESESLFNDGVAAVLVSIALINWAGSELSVGFVLSSLLREVGGGVLAGAAVAWLALFFSGRTTDHLIELTITTVAAFGSFLLAEHFHCSGVLAVLVAGLVIGNLGHLGSITEPGRVSVVAFWEFAAFVSNSIIFLLIGVRERELGVLLAQEWQLILLAIGASLLGRAISVYGVSKLLARGAQKIERRHQHVLVWGGLKGALSLALAIGLPANMPHREEVVVVAFGVVAFSVIVQGLSMPSLMRHFRLLGEPEPAKAA